MILSEKHHKDNNIGWHRGGEEISYTYNSLDKLIV